MTAVAYNPDDTIILRQLLDAGADINAQDKDGRTALISAAFYNRREAVSVLLARGADPSIRDNNGRNAAATVRDSAPELHRLLDDAAKRRR
jgi:ankyrin repeat protein